MDLRRRCIVVPLLLVTLLVAPCMAAVPAPPQAAAQVDHLLAREVPAEEPAPQTDDAAYLRRVSLDLIGRPPTEAELRRFEASSNPHKRRQLVETLLADVAFGENWARYWRDVIMYRRTEPRARLAANALLEYLTDRCNANTPWDRIATDFITATGDVRENGATALIMAQAGMPEEVAAEVSRIFLGVQIQCAQCHDHPLDRWQRTEFHQLAAFFPRVAVRPTRGSDVRSFEVVVNDRDFVRRRRNNNNRFVGTPEHNMPDLDDPQAPGTPMQPAFFLNGQDLPFGTVDARRRGTLAAWATSRENPWFARAFVNRMWAELVGEGFYEPVDDLGPDRECGAPETIDYLSSAFAASGYDIKWLFRTITATTAYQRQSRSRRDYDEPAFQANCPQRLRGDQLFDSLTAALDLRPLAGRGRTGNELARGAPRARFDAVFGYDPSEPRSEVTLSIPQALLLMNAPLVNRAINARRPGGLGDILRRFPEDRQATVELYRKTLAREPSPAELRTCLLYVRRTGNRQEAFEDIQWALVNATEFLYRE